MALGSMAVGTLALGSILVLGSKVVGKDHSMSCNLCSSLLATLLLQVKVLAFS